MGKTLFVPSNTSTRKCNICGQEFKKEDILVPDGDLCSTCKKEYGGMAFVYCNTCKAVVSRVEPGMTESGFLVKPRDLLHIKECPNCNPLLVNIVPEEMKEYEKSR